MQIQHVGVGLNTDEAKQRSGGTSPEKYNQVEVWLPGEEDPLILTRDAERGIAVVNPFRHPDSADQIKFFEKDSLLAMRDAGRIKTEARASGDKEWDQLRVSFSKEESASLTDADMNRIRETIAATLRADPKGGIGERMVLVWPSHTDTGNKHIDIMVHRHASDIDAGYASTTIDMGKVAAMQAEILNAVLKEKGLPSLSEWRGPGGQSIFTDKGVKGAYRTDAEVAVEEAGGRPRTGVPSAEREVFTPEEERVIKHKESEQKELTDLFAQRAEVDRRIAAKTQSVADADHALAAIQENKSLREQLAVAKAEVEIERDAVVELDVELRAERTKVAEIGAALEAEQSAHGITTEQLMREQEAREKAEALAVERATVIEDLTGKLEAEEEAHKATGERLTDEVVAHEKTRQALAAEQEARAAVELRAEGLGTELNAAQQRIGQLEKDHEGLTAELADLKASVTQLKGALEAEQQARAATAAELQQERDSIPQRIKAAVDEAVAAVRAEANERMQAMQSRFDAAMASMQKTFDAATAAKDSLIATLTSQVDHLRTAAAAPLQKAADAVRGAPRSEPHAYWYTVPPKDWTAEQTQGAQRALEAEQAKGKKAGWTLEQYGEGAHKDWLKRNPPKADEAAPTGGDAPKPGRK